MKRIIECVPNFSEGQRPAVIEAIASAIGEVEGAKVLHIDPGADTNRTVITFAGAPEAVTEAAFRGTRRAAELIDMRTHHGKHPRIGATDVLPLVPVQGVTLEECAQMARDLARRIYRELGIPVYCYEAAAYKASHRNLTLCRRGEYEALPRRMADADEMPDFGGGRFTPQAERSGASVVGARNFLVAVNFDLNSRDARLATEIACDVRQSGRTLRDPATGEPERDADGKARRIPGTLLGCKAIGWFIEEYDRAQVSMNITDIDATPLHTAFEEVSRAAAARGARVTGTEIIGLLPLRCLLEAGRFYAAREGLAPLGEEQTVALAVERMNLSELAPFDPHKKVIEYLLKE